MRQAEIIQKWQEDFFQDLGLSQLPSQQREQILEQLGQVVLKEIFLEIIQTLSSQDKEKFQELLEKDDVKGVKKFLSAKVPDYEEMIIRIMENLKKELKENLV